VPDKSANRIVIVAVISQGGRLSILLAKSRNIGYSDTSSFGRMTWPRREQRA
jgi:hypothetical protein